MSNWTINNSQISISPHDQGEQSTCYAYAIATAFSAVIFSHKNKKEKEAFRQKLYNRIVKKFGIDSAFTYVVATYYADRYNLQVKLIDPKTYEDKSTVILTFAMTAKQWSAFQEFFDDDQTRLKTLTTLPPCDGDLSGHAVVLRGHSLSGYWKCKNSWGMRHGDEGNFRISKDLVETLSPNFIKVTPKNSFAKQLLGSALVALLSKKNLRD